MEVQKGACCPTLLIKFQLQCLRLSYELFDIRGQAKQVSDQEYEEATRRSDYTTIIPLLFNLHHGIELLLKGFLQTDLREDIKKTHDIIDLCSRFYHLFPDETVLNNFFHKYTWEHAMPEILKQFLRDNRIDIRSLYQALRYPSPDFKIMRDYSGLKYKGKEGVHVFSDLQSEIEGVRKSAVALGRSLEPNENEGQQEAGQLSSEGTPSEEVSA